MPEALSTCRTHTPYAPCTPPAQRRMLLRQGVALAHSSSSEVNRRGGRDEEGVRELWLLKCPR
jgi:hypothetical protein